MKRLVFTLFFFLMVGKVFGQYQGECRSSHYDYNINDYVCDEYYYYDTHDVY